MRTEWFAAQVEQRSSAAIAISISGNADMEIHQQLKEFLDEVHSLAKHMRASEVVFQFHDLYFINSSCMSLFLRFVNNDLAERPADQYRIRLCSNPEQRWQRKSFDAMQAYARELVSVE